VGDGHNPRYGESLQPTAARLKMNFAGLPAGTHNREILLDIGYTEEDVAAFKKSGLFD